MILCPEGIIIKFSMLGLISHYRKVPTCTTILFSYSQDFTYTILFKLHIILNIPPIILYFNVTVWLQ